MCLLFCNCKVTWCWSNASEWAVCWCFQKHASMVRNRVGVNGSLLWKPPFANTCFGNVVFPSRSGNLQHVKVSKMEKHPIRQQYLPRSTLRLNQRDWYHFYSKKQFKICLISRRSKLRQGHPVASGLMEHIVSEVPSEWPLLLMNVACATTCQRKLEIKAVWPL